MTKRLIPPEDAVRIGPHCLWIEGDMYVAVLEGDITLDHVVAMQRISQPLSETHGYVLSMVDARRSGTITPDARRASASFQREQPRPGAVGVFGTGILLRAMHVLYSRAVSLLTNTQREMALFKTEAETRLWLDSQRIRLSRIVLGHPAR